MRVYFGISGTFYQITFWKLIKYMARLHWGSFISPSWAVLTKKKQVDSDFETIFRRWVHKLYKGYIFSTDLPVFLGSRTTVDGVWAGRNESMEIICCENISWVVAKQILTSKGHVCCLFLITSVDSRMGFENGTTKMKKCQTIRTCKKICDCKSKDGCKESDTSNNDGGR